MFNPISIELPCWRGAKPIPQTSNLPRDAPPNAHADIRHRVGEVLASIADVLILPTIAQHPDTNPYRATS